MTTDAKKLHMVFGRLLDLYTSNTFTFVVDKIVFRITREPTRNKTRYRFSHNNQTFMSYVTPAISGHVDGVVCCSTEGSARGISDIYFWARSREDPKIYEKWYNMVVAWAASVPSSPDIKFDKKEGSGMVDMHDLHRRVEYLLKTNSSSTDVNNSSITIDIWDKQFTITKTTDVGTICYEFSTNGVWFMQYNVQPARGPFGGILYQNGELTVISVSDLKYNHVDLFQSADEAKSYGEFVINKIKRVTYDAVVCNSSVTEKKDIKTMVTVNDLSEIDPFSLRNGVRLFLGNNSSGTIPSSEHISYTIHFSRYKPDWFQYQFFVNSKLFMTFYENPSDVNIIVEAPFFSGEIGKEASLYHLNNIINKIANATGYVFNIRKIVSFGEDASRAMSISDELANKLGAEIVNPVATGDIAERLGAVAAKMDPRISVMHWDDGRGERGNVVKGALEFMAGDTSLADSYNFLSESFDNYNLVSIAFTHYEGHLYVLKCRYNNQMQNIKINVKGLSLLDVKEIIVSILSKYSEFLAHHNQPKTITIGHDRRIDVPYDEVDAALDSICNNAVYKDKIKRTDDYFTCSLVIARSSSSGNLQIKDYRNSGEEQICELAEDSVSVDNIKQFIIDYLFPKEKEKPIEVIFDFPEHPAINPVERLRVQSVLYSIAIDPKYKDKIRFINNTNTNRFKASIVLQHNSNMDITVYKSKRHPHAFVIGGIAIMSDQQLKETLVNFILNNS